VDKNTLDFAHIQGSLAGPPVKKTKMDMKKKDFEICTLSLSSQRQKDGVDIFFKSEVLQYPC
jgi:hypothetical protein